MLPKKTVFQCANYIFIFFLKGILVTFTAGPNSQIFEFKYIYIYILDGWIHTFFFKKVCLGMIYISYMFIYIYTHCIFMCCFFERNQYPGLAFLSSSKCCGPVAPKKQTPSCQTGLIPVSDFQQLTFTSDVQKMLGKYQLVWSNYSHITRPGPLKGSFLEGKSSYFSEI